MSESKEQIVERVGKALTVRLAQELHAIPIARIEEVLPALPVESVPQCPSFVGGVVFVRGHLIPILSAAERLGLKNYQRPDEPHIVCISTGGQLVGVEFDEALDLIDIGEVESLDAEAIGGGEGFFTAVIEYEGAIIRLLNPDKLLGVEETAELEPLPPTV